MAYFLPPTVKCVVRAFIPRNIPENTLEVIKKCPKNSSVF
jgi:hypothetical protein